MAKLLVTKEEIILIKNSESGKNHELYGNLYPVLQTYEKLTDDDFNKNTFLDSKARSVILNNKKLLINEIKDEWYASNYTFETSAEIHCQLCGRKNKQIFYIHNRINENELNVGSDCINKFPSIANLSKIKHTANEEKKQKTEIKRRIEFDEIDLTNIDYIKSSESWFDNFQILLPNPLYNNIKTILFNLNSLKTSYIKHGGNFKETKNQYFEFKQMLDTYKTDAYNLYNSNKLNPLVCKKELSDWLAINHPDIRGKIQANDGILNQSTLQYCYQPEYVKKHLKLFALRMLNKGINIININGPFIRFKIENSDYLYPLYFNMSCKLFMQKIGCYCLTDKSYTYSKKDLSNVTVEQTSNNFNSMCNRLISPLEKIGLKIERNLYTNEIYYVRLPYTQKLSKWSDRTETFEIAYKKVDEKAIFLIFNNVIFASDTEIQTIFTKILNKLNSTGKWITKDEKEKMEEISKSLSIQQQRQFTPY